MPKNVSLPPVRVEPEMKQALQHISDETGVSVYELTRQAVSEYIARQRGQVGKYYTPDRLMVVADGETLNQA